MAAVEIKIPSLGESVTEGTIARWLKTDGARVEVDENLLELETDKAMMELPAEVAGRLEIQVEAGQTVAVGDVVGKIHEGEDGDEGGDDEAAASETTDTGGQEAGTEDEAAAAEADQNESDQAEEETIMSPASRKLVEEHDLDPAEIDGSGKDGRILKEDVQRHIETSDELTEEATSGADSEPEKSDSPAPAAEPKKPTAAQAPQARAAATPPPQTSPAPRDAGEQRVQMSRIRQRIAERLVEAQQTAAILTTFNDIDMSGVLELRRRYKETFQERHGVKLGFMSLFGRASCLALREFREINAFIDGTDIVYHDHVNLGIAVSTERGLLVPVIRNADQLPLFDLEKKIAEVADRARNNKIMPDDLAGGTFSLTNGGIYGSLLSTPILNPPQSGILGMHRIEERPVAVDGEVVIRPMMYVALSYDHRIVDGEQAVKFLVRVKEYLEDPARMVLEL